MVLSRNICLLQVSAVNMASGNGMLVPCLFWVYGKGINKWKLRDSIEVNFERTLCAVYIQDTLKEYRDVKRLITFLSKLNFNRNIRKSIKSI